MPPMVRESPLQNVMTTGHFVILLKYKGNVSTPTC